MTIMGYNEFQRKLNELGVQDENVRYLFSLLYEQLSELSQHLDMQSSLLLGLAKQLEAFVNLNEVTQGRLKEFIRNRKTPGVEVGSVSNEPEGD